MRDLNLCCLGGDIGGVLHPDVHNSRGHGNRPRRLQQRLDCVESAGMSPAREPQGAVAEVFEFGGASTLGRGVGEA